MDLIKNKKTEFEKTVEYLRTELSTLRTGRASSGLVESLIIDYYGAKTPLLQLAQITVPEPRVITIQPYDKAALPAIEKAIQASTLGINPSNEGSLIRLVIPPMTEERRKDMVKTVSQLGEKARVAIRNIREEIWKEIQKQEKDGKITEDEQSNAKEELQEVVDEKNEEIKKISEAKEKEVMTV